MTGLDHYEVELHEVTCESDSSGGFRITSSSWIPIRLCPRGLVPALLTFDSLDDAQTYAGRHRVDAVRVVRVMEEGGREVVAPAETKAS
jgi:hypothetical protein